MLKACLVSFKESQTQFQNEIDFGVSFQFWYISDVHTYFDFFLHLRYINSHLKLESTSSSYVGSDRLRVTVIRIYAYTDLNNR